MPTVADSSDHSVLQDTVDLLRSEVELLQVELADRDEQLARRAGSEPVNDLPDSSIVDERVDRLLFELQQSDHRIAALEDVARLSEEARYAEAEERREIESWVQDIEKRIAEREREIQAECELLRGKLQSAEHERSTALVHVDQLIAQNTDDPNLEDILEVQRRDNETLRERAELYEEKCRDLQLKNEQLQAENNTEFVEQQVAEAVRKERLDLAQERAALSRRELELAGKVKELQLEIESKGKTHQADQRFRAFKEQLAVLHQQDKAETVQETMCQRLVRLWNRLDGPTDRD